MTQEDLEFIAWLRAREPITTTNIVDLEDQDRKPPQPDGNGIVAYRIPRRLVDPAWNPLLHGYIGEPWYERGRWQQ